MLFTLQPNPTTEIGILKNEIKRHVICWYKLKVKVKVTLEQTTKAQKGIRGVAQLFL
jgi:hypothetical protein